MAAARATAPFLDRWRRVVERHPGCTIAVVGLACAAVYAGAFLTGASRGDAIRGDAVQYYAYLRSLVFDADLHFANEYERFYAEDSVWRTERTPTGRPPNMMSIGPALLWLPVFALATGLAWLASAAGIASPPDGYGLGLQVTAGLCGIAYATVGSYCCFRAAALRFPREAALWATLVAWLASPALYYTVVSPAYSHATTIFTMGVFVWAWMSGLGRVGARRFLLLGALAGLAALVRWQDAIVVLLPAVELLRGVIGRVTTPARAAGLGLCLAAGFAIGVSPQLIAWHAIYGSYVTVPQGSGFMQWTDPAIWAVLFSSRRGLFVWTPAVLLAAVGLVWVWRRDRLAGAGLTAVLAVAIYVNAAVADWWAGEAFGARRFISMTPIFAVGLAALGARVGGRRPGTVAVTTIALVAYNGLLLLQYQLFMRGHRDLVAYPTTYADVLIERLRLPFRLLWEWLGR
ncbi:MAG TPA: hypothetical protein VMM93_11915 [Vicinamibacterales bacterium]|nr:hypothetical protein [Vicinamibacterales bacterium]